MDKNRPKIVKKATKNVIRKHMILFIIHKLVLYFKLSTTIMSIEPFRHKWNVNVSG